MPISAAAPECPYARFYESGKMSHKWLVNGKRFGVAVPTVSLAQVGRGREIVSSTSTAVWEFQ